MVKIQPGNPLNTLMIPARIRNKKKNLWLWNEVPPVICFFNIVVPHIRGFRSDLCCTGLPGSINEVAPNGIDRKLRIVLRQTLIRRRCSKVTLCSAVFARSHRFFVRLLTQWKFCGVLCITI